MAGLAQLRAWNAALQIGELDPSDAREARLYVPLEQTGHSAIDEIGAAIQLSVADESVHLVSGPRGSGKSTELLQLKDGLSKDGYRVVRFDMLDFVSETQPLDVEIFLVVIGLATTQALVGVDTAGPGFAGRLRGWLAGWRPGEFSVGGGVGSGPAQASFNVKFERDEDLHSELRRNPNFVEFLRNQVSFYLRDLKDHVDEHVRQLADEHGNGLPLVVIVDSLERIGSGPHADGESAGLFVEHPDKLRFPGTHVVYTVPPEIPVLYPGVATISHGVLHQIAVPRVLTAGAEGHGVSVERFVEAVDLRIDGRRELLDDAGLERIVLASGGHLDDLFNLLTRLINLTLARRAETPVDASVVEAAIADVRANLAPRTEEQAQVIAWVAESGEWGQPSEGVVVQLAQLLSSHMVLHRRNDHDWYEVHPLTAEALAQERAG